jgi:hypothetical protein
LIEAEVGNGPRVFVDAKVVGRHETPKRTAVAYLVKDEVEMANGTDVDADETDDAELHAVAFAIHELQDKFPAFTIICDHESVVSVINSGNQKAVKKRPILSKILTEMRANPGIKVQALEGNHAHRYLNKWLAEHPST